VDPEPGCDLAQPVAVLAVGGEDRRGALLGEQARERVAKRLTGADDLPSEESTRLVRTKASQVARDRRGRPPQAERVQNDVAAELEQVRLALDQDPP
jgi:hypothetical protein